jgi:tetratricopeptide (TPR) repeat protein
MWDYKGTKKFDIGSSVLEYDFFTINGEDDFWEIINFCRAKVMSFDYFLDGYRTHKNNTNLSTLVQAEMKEHNANLCLTFGETECIENYIYIRKMIVNEQKHDGSYDYFCFYFYLFERDEIKKIIDKASAFSEHNFHKAAIAYYSEAIELVPEEAILYFYRGNERCQREYFDEAIEDYNKAIEIDTDYVNAYIVRARAYASKSNFDAAIADCTKAIQLDPQNDAAYGNRGVAYANKECFDNAIADCSKAVEIDPDDDWGYTIRGQVYMKKGDLNSAKADFLEALEIYPDNWCAKEGIESLNQITDKTQDENNNDEDINDEEKYASKTEMRISNSNIFEIILFLIIIFGASMIIWALTPFL